MVRPEGRRDSGGRAGWVAVAAATVPIVVAGVRASIDDWVPIGDNGVLLVRSRDVLTEHHPFLGTWTSASVSTGKSFNNPGPLFWDVLALPTKLLGANPGMVGAIMALNVASIVVAALVARRIAGSAAMALVAAVGAAVAWTMGSALVIDPWQPNALVLPFLCFLVAVWGLASGRWALMPLVVAVGSYLLQTHLSYVYVVPALALLGVVMAVLARRRDRAAQDPGALHPKGLSRPVWAVVWSVALFVVLWGQTFWEQWFGPGEGNLSRLLDATGTDAERIGWSFALRLLAQVTAVPPFWGRSSYVEAITPRPVSLGVALAVLGVALALLVTALVLSWRARDHVAVAAVVTVVVGLVAGLATIAYVPIDSNLGVSGHQMRWLWVLSAFWMAVVVFALVRRLGPPASTRGLALGGLVAALVLGLANLPSFSQPAGPNSDSNAAPQIAGLTGEMVESLEGVDSVLLDLSGARYGDPFGMPVMAELQDQGIDFYMTDPNWLRQVGSSRRYHRGDADIRLYLRAGPEALEVPPGSTLVAQVLGLHPPEKAEMDALAEDLTAAVKQNGLVLTPAGRRAQELAKLPMPDDTLENPDRAAGYVEFGYVPDLLRDGYATSPGIPVERFVRLGELQWRWFLNTAALFSKPIHAP